MSPPSVPTTTVASADGECVPPEVLAQVEARLRAAVEDTEVAVHLVRGWLIAARKAIADETMPLAKRVRLGEFALDAARWLEAREARIAGELRGLQHQNSPGAVYLRRLLSRSTRG